MLIPFLNDGEKLFSRRSLTGEPGAVKRGEKEFSHVPRPRAFLVFLE
jgi:hypothetical protein